MRMPASVSRALRRWSLPSVLVLGLGLAACEPALAAASKDFDALWTMLSEWSSGTLGKVISLAFLLVGLGIGVIRGSIVGAISCLAAAVSLLMAPSIIDSMFTASGN